MRRLYPAPGLTERHVQALIDRAVSSDRRESWSGCFDAPIVAWVSSVCGLPGTAWGVVEFCGDAIELIGSPGTEVGSLWACTGAAVRWRSRCCRGATVKAGPRSRSSGRSVARSWRGGTFRCPGPRSGSGATGRQCLNAPMSASPTDWAELSLPGQPIRPRRLVVTDPQPHIPTQFPTDRRRRSAQLHRGLPDRQTRIPQPGGFEPLITIKKARRTRRTRCPVHPAHGATPSPGPRQVRAHGRETPGRRPRS